VLTHLYADAPYLYAPGGATRVIAYSNNITKKGEEIK